MHFLKFIFCISTCISLCQVHLTLFKSPQQSAGWPSTPNLRLRTQISPCLIHPLFLPLLSILLARRTMKRIRPVAISDLYLVTEKRSASSMIQEALECTPGHSVDDPKACKTHSEFPVGRRCCYKYRRFPRVGPRPSTKTGLVVWQKIQEEAGHQGVPHRSPAPFRLAQGNSQRPLS